MSDEDRTYQAAIDATLDEPGNTLAARGYRLAPRRRPSMLDLFSGLEGWASRFRAAGFDTTTLDYEPRFDADIVADILTAQTLDELYPSMGARPWDVITASPPCEAFSTGSIGRHWGGGAKAYEPKTDAARTALAIVKHTFALIDAYVARHPSTLYIIENPRGVMRKIAPRSPTDTTWYCKWGERRAKPTDLWTNTEIFAPGRWPKCCNGADDHDAQSRSYWKRQELGQTGGTQGLKDAATRAVIPAMLADTVAAYALARIAAR